MVIYFTVDREQFRRRTGPTLATRRMYDLDGNGITINGPREAPITGGNVASWILGGLWNIIGLRYFGGLLGWNRQDLADYEARMLAVPDDQNEQGGGQLPALRRNALRLYEI